MQTPNAPKREPVPLNGVNTPKLFAAINAVRDVPELAEFSFRARNRWLAGTHSATTIESFKGACATQSHHRAFEYAADHPAVLVGDDHAPTPVEFLLHALASCLTAGVANIAAARGVALSEVTSTVEGEINLLGILGLSDKVRNGYQRISVRFDIQGDAPKEQLRTIVEQARARSAVFDVLTNGVPVDIEVND